VTHNVWLELDQTACFKGGVIQLSQLVSDQFGAFVDTRQSSVRQLHVSRSEGHAQLATRCLHILNHELAAESMATRSLFNILTRDASDEFVRKKLLLYSSRLWGLLYASEHALMNHARHVISADIDLQYAIAQFVDQSIWNWLRIMAILSRAGSAW
jgi:hypothetical protein